MPRSEYSHWAAASASVRVLLIAMKQSCLPPINTGFRKLICYFFRVSIALTLLECQSCPVLGEMPVFVIRSAIFW